jgi:hypothetical protein
MKQSFSIALTLVFAVLGFASIANASECGTLEVTSFNGQNEFTLNQGSFAQDLTVNNTKLNRELVQYNGRAVCLQIDGTRDEYGDAEYIVTGFSPEN